MKSKGCMISNVMSCLQRHTILVQGVHVVTFVMVEFGCEDCVLLLSLLFRGKQQEK